MENINEVSNTLSGHQLFITFLKNLRNHLIKYYKDDFYISSISFLENITFFAFTPKELKELKLKTVIVYNHKMMQFEIWFAGQNKEIQKKYWLLFKDSDWNKYTIPSTITNSFSIVETILAQSPDFKNDELLAHAIENKALEFINDIKEVLL